MPKLFYLPLDSGPDSSVGGPTVDLVWEEKNRSVHLPNLKLLTSLESLKSFRNRTQDKCLVFITGSVHINRFLR